MSLHLLFEYFDKQLPVKIRQEDDFSKEWQLFGYDLCINIKNDMHLPEKLLYKIHDLQGVHVEVKILPHYPTDIACEFFVFKELLTTINSKLDFISYQYICLQGESKLIPAIAQRLTLLRPNVEHIASVHPYFIIW